MVKIIKLQSHIGLDILKSIEYVDYPDAIEFMENYIADIASGNQPEAIWFLEHTDILTAGTSADDKDLFNQQGFPVYKTGRGGMYTYHGPRQLIVYVMIDLGRRKWGVKEFVKKLENLIINALKYYNLQGHIRDGRVGVWIENNNFEDKIAAIGIRIRKSISFHGFAVNLAPNLQHFSAIVPCGINGHGVTSLEKLGHEYNRDLFEQNIIAGLEEFLL